MKKFYLSLLTILIFYSASFSQTVNYYAFSTSSGAALDPMTGATTIVPANTDNAPSSVQSISFTFGYDGKNYTQFSASPDGFLQFGPTAATANPYNNTYSIKSSIFPLWSNFTTGAGGSVSFLVTGAAPNRILKVQWFLAIPTSAGNANSTMQAWLYEGTNVIQFRYGSGGNPSSGASIGIKGAAGDFMSVTTSSNTASTSSPNDNNRFWPGAGTMYIFTPPAVSSCTRPTDQPTSLTAPDKFTTAIGGYFNGASSNPAGYLVIRSLGAFTGTPVDGLDYNGGDTIGNGIVVQSGNTKSYTAMGLTGNTQYTITVLSYNSGLCSGGPLYNTTSPPTVSARTCTAAPSPAAANLTTTSALLKWPSTKGGGASPVTYTVDVATNSGFSSPVAGSPFTVNEPDTLVNITGLTENTTYYYRVKATATCTTIIGYNFTTPCSPTSMPFVQNFDAATSPGLPACNMAQDLQGNTAWTTAPAPKNYTGNVGQFTYNNYQYADDWLYMQGVNLTGGIPYTITYKFGNDSALYADGQSESLEVKYGTSPLSTSMTNLLKSRANFSFRAPQVDTVKFTPATTGTYYFGFHAFNYIFSSTPYYLYLDSIVIRQTGQTLPVLLANFSAARNGSVNNVTWSTTEEVNTSKFVVERSNDGQNYSAIGEVNAVNSSNTSHFYQFTDPSPAKGNNYYRLKIIDKDVNSKLSEIRMVKNSLNVDFSIYPNPVTDILKVDINAIKSDKGVIIINDVNGRLLYHKAVNVVGGNNQFSINISNIEKGTYIIKVQLSDAAVVNKITRM